MEACRVNRSSSIVPSMDVTDWKSANVFMIDFEGSPESGVVEYGVVHLHGGSIAGVDTGLCRPTGRIEAREMRVHNIGEAEAAHFPPFSEHFDRFVAYRRKGIFAAHNRHAENAFIKNTWPLPPLVPDWRERMGKSQEWGPWIDTLSIFKTLYPNLGSYALGDLVDTFGLREALQSKASLHCPANRKKPHCALYDALASSLLLLHIEESEELSGRISLSWLLQMSRAIQAQQELF